MPFQDDTRIDPDFTARICVHWPCESCNIDCVGGDYDGSEFQYDLLRHIEAMDELDMLHFSHKTVRAMVAKWARYLDESTFSRWMEYPHKFSAEEKSLNPNAEVEYVSEFTKRRIVPN
jgi:hypothetical protein